jgi:hypothetical protein
MPDILPFLKNHGLIQASLPPTFHEGMPFTVRPSISLVAVSEPLGALKRYAREARIDTDDEGSDQEKADA